MQQDHNAVISLPEGGAEVGPAPAPALGEMVIRPSSGWRMVDFPELWRYRELLYFLTWRDIKVRYKQAVIGAAWAVVQPVATMVVFSLFFRRLGNGGPQDLPYPLFVFSGLLPWIFFAHAVSESSQSVVASQNLITKIYFPRLMVPLGAVGAGLVDFAISCLLLLGMMVAYRVGGHAVLPGWGALLLPALVLGLLAGAVGVGTLLSALTVAYRDFRYVVPFLVQLWMFATPSIYLQSSSALNPRWQILLPLNPAYGLIANFRAAILGTPLDPYSLTVSLAVSGLFLLVGCAYFRRVERGFADVI